MGEQNRSYRLQMFRQDIQKFTDKGKQIFIVIKEDVT